MMQVGAKNLSTDVKGILVGNAHDEVMKTGVSVVSGPTAFTASYCVMGGAPGTRETDLLAPDKTVAEVDALVLSGGSAFGVDAATGVVDQLRKAGRGFVATGYSIPLVPAAILFDLSNGGDKNWSENPYPELGRRAYDALDDRFDVGSIGAGFGAQCGMMKGGLGSASFTLSNGVTVGALVAANPVGNPTDASGKYFWAAPFEVDAEYGGFGAPKAGAHGQSLDQTKLGALEARANTSIAIVATDAALSKAEAHRLSTVAHDGFARAIVPSHLPMDGDLIFAAATGNMPAPKTLLEFSEICHAASLCVARAVARGVFHASAHPGDRLKTYQELNSG